MVQHKKHHAAKHKPHRHRASKHKHKKPHTHDHVKTHLKRVSHDVLELRALRILCNDWVSSRTIPDSMVADSTCALVLKKAVHFEEPDSRSWAQLRTSIDYKAMTVKKAGKGYTDSVNWSHYDEPIDQKLGRAAGNSRRWGDASEDTQIKVIDALIAAAKSQGLTVREAAHVIAIARVESGFNPDAAAGTTSASGLGQFIDKTGAA